MKLKTENGFFKGIASGVALTGLIAFGATAAFNQGFFPPAHAQAPRLLSPNAAGDGTLSFADLVERVSPAVVSILVEREVEQPEVPEELERFFQFRRAPQQNDDFDGAPRMEAQGSGFFVDVDGHIVTNNHVIEGADEIRVRLTDGKELTAELIGSDPLTDLAVLKVKADKSRPFVAFSDDVNLRVGDWVVAVGNPFGLSGTVTSGIVSAIGRDGGQFTDFIQIDAPINRGNSGGPTFDLKGRVVGVNTAIYSTTGGSVGIGFAIPAKLAKDTVAQLIETGSVTRGWLGVSIQPLDDSLAGALGLDDEKGALVTEVLPETPAAKAGFESGDLVLTVDSKAIDDPRDLTQTISAFAPGEKVRVKILRGGKEKTLSVTLGERDAEPSAANDNTSSPEDDESLSAKVGIKVARLTQELRDQFRVPEGTDGVVITGVQRNSAAAEAGLRPGVIILQADYQSVTTPEALERVVLAAEKAGKEALFLQIQLGQVKQFSALPLSSGDAG